MTFDNFISVLELLISWPAAILIITVYLSHNFKSEVSQCLSQVVKLKLPGGTEIERQIIVPSKDLDAISNVNYETDYSKKMSQFVEEKLNSDNDSKLSLKDAIVGGYLYKHAYLNDFFVDDTKRLLSLAVDKSPLSLSELLELSAGLGISNDQACLMLELFKKFQLSKEKKGKYEFNQEAMLLRGKFDS